MCTKLKELGATELIATKGLEVVKSRLQAHIQKDRVAAEQVAEVGDDSESENSFLAAQKETEDELKEEALVTPESVMTQYVEYAKLYRKSTIKQLSSTIKTNVEIVGEEHDKLAQLEKMVYGKLDESRGHELTFWKQYSAADVVGAKQMAQTACELLSIQATSASPERIFSKSGLVIRKHRTNLTAENGAAFIKAAINKDILSGN